MSQTKHDGAVRQRETEPLGITYDRLRLDALLTRLVRERGIKTAWELPADGAKAMPSIYSLALARAGVHVTLYRPEEQGLEVWRRLGLIDKVTAVYEGTPAATGLPDRSFDLVWNFVSVGFRPDFGDIIGEMARLSNRHVLTVHCNGFNWGYPWHKLLHAAFRLPWTHGETAYFFPNRVRDVYRGRGLNPAEFGHLDMPWWPDPPGFRDVRLHLSGGDRVEDLEWTAPIEAIYAGGEVPKLVQRLAKIEESEIPTPVRTVFSHLFYQLGERTSA
jgi:hypothetical protein